MMPSSDVTAAVVINDCTGKTVEGAECATVTGYELATEPSSPTVPLSVAITAAGESGSSAGVWIARTLVVPLSEWSSSPVTCSPFASPGVAAGDTTAAHPCVSFPGRFERQTTARGCCSQVSRYSQVQTSQ